MEFFICVIVAFLAFLLYLAIVVDLLLRWRGELERRENALYKAIKRLSLALEGDKRVLSEGLKNIDDIKIFLSSVDSEPALVRYVEDRLDAYLCYCSSYDKRIGNWFVRPVAKRLGVEKSLYKGNKA